MELKNLPGSVDHSQMEIISEVDIPFDCDPEQINEDIVLASKFFSALAVADHKRKNLKDQKQQVLDWFDKEEEKIEKNEEFLREKLEQALYSAEQNGAKKPKVKNWAGTAYFTTRNKTDWGGLTNKSPEVIKFAKKHKLNVEVIEKANLKDVKKVLLDQPEDERELDLKIRRNKSLTVKINN